MNRQPLDQAAHYMSMITVYASCRLHCVHYCVKAIQCDVASFMPKYTPSLKCNTYK